ncbi:hypothetical protein D3C71_1543110 [compost metagenome]
MFEWCARGGDRLSDLSVVIGVFFLNYRKDSSALQAIVPDKRNFNDERTIES